MLGKPYRVAALALLLVTSLGLPAGAQNGKSTVQDLVRVFSGWKGTRVDAVISSEAARKIDYPGMAQATLGPARWESLTGSEKQQFVSNFRGLIERRYYPRWHRLFNKGTFTMLGEETGRNGTVVKTRFSVGRKSDLVLWRLHTCNGEMMVTDLYVDDKDLLSHLKSRFQRLLAKRGTQGLIAWMKNKLDDDDAVELSGASAAVRTR